jgi:site-specific DNA-methyltransferase (adenine-specific)
MSLFEDSIDHTPLEFVSSIDDNLSLQYPSQYERNGIHIFQGDSLNIYNHWSSPVAIISDGPYGISGFSGDLATYEGLAEWYEPHIKKWSELSTPLTTLWFWNTEIGWATVHPILKKYHWLYRGTSIWDKGVAHIAGNCNTQTIRRLPTVSEVCVQYVKEARIVVNSQEMSIKEWLRIEWLRTGLPLSKTNEACGVKNAATRKYFTQDHLWYFPPVEAFEKLCEYANKYGSDEGRPFFSIDGKKPLSGMEWSRMRAKFRCEHGVTNVWHEPAVRNSERFKQGQKALHTNQKPLCLNELIIRLCTDENDVVWEPFGGLCTAAIASYRLGRRCFSAEIEPQFYNVAISRLAHYKDSIS